MERAEELTEGAVVLEVVALLEPVVAGDGALDLEAALANAIRSRSESGTASFSPALYDTFAIITRPGARLSPGVRKLLTELEAHMRAIADEFDRSR